MNPNNNALKFNRRQFMASAAAVALATHVPASAKVQNERLGVGVIGCGGRGTHHLQVLKEIAGRDKTIEIVAVCDAYRPRMEAAAKNFNAKAYMDHREMLDDPNVDIVSIATPDHLHGYQAIDAARKGKHIYCEKPVTHWRQFDLIKQLNAEIKQTGVAFQLGTQGMSDAAWRQMKQLVAEGKIGQPVHAECGYFRTGDWGERGMPIPDPDVKPGSDLNWEAFLGDSPKRDYDVSRYFRWRMYEDYAGGPVTDLFPHSLTPVLSILGVTFPNKAVATGGMFRYTEREVPDTFNMLIDYPEKITVAVLGTQGNDYQGTENRGAGQRIPVIRGWDAALTIQGEDIVLFPTQESKGKEHRFAIEHGENTLYHFRNLIDCVLTGNHQTSSDVDLAYHTQTALLMGMASLRDERTVKFDADKETIIS